MPTTDLTPGTVTTLGALRPGDMGEFVRADGDSEPFVVIDVHPTHEATRIHKVTDHSPYWADWNGKIVRYLGWGRVEPARIVMEGKGDRIAELEEQVRTLREALNMYRSAFGQALEAHGIPLGPQQRLADEISEAALAATAPKDKS